MESSNLHQLLWVLNDTSVEEISRNFCKLSVLSPDLRGTSDFFVFLQRAHRILTDIDDRAEYDHAGGRTHTPIVCYEMRKPHTSHYPSRSVTPKNNQQFTGDILNKCWKMQQKYTKLENSSG